MRLRKFQQYPIVVPSLTGSSIHKESITEANDTSLQTKHSMESDLDMTQISNDNMTHVTQELLKLKPDIMMEMTVMTSEVMKEMANAKDEISGLKSQVVNIQAEVSEIRCDVVAIKAMLQNILS
jgi:septal ring factor EnvC (AmiA/AmiB activator)